ncbi:metallophosphoesterase, partial [Bacillus sp. SIMBA_069]
EKYANFSENQIEWLKEDVKAAKANGSKWVIVNIHKGPYTTSNHATDDDIMDPNGVRNQVAPLMAELDIDFVLQGHDHIYA